MEMMDIEDIVLKLVGPVDAVGESHEDVKRLKNLKVLTELVDRLLATIYEASQDANREEASMRIIGKHAADFLEEVRLTR